MVQCLLDSITIKAVMRKQASTGMFYGCPEDHQCVCVCVCVHLRMCTWALGWGGAQQPVLIFNVNETDLFWKSSLRQHPPIQTWKNLNLVFICE